MSIYANVADERELGLYGGYVRSVRNGSGKAADDILLSIMCITPPKLLEIIRQVLSAHPDWDDEDVATILYQIR